MRKPGKFWRPDRSKVVGGDDQSAWIPGLHSVAAALNNPARSVIRLHVTRNARIRLAEMATLPSEELISLQSPDRISKMLGVDLAHQGALLEAKPLENPGLGILHRANLMLVSDGISDPRNIGALLRTAAAFKVEALISVRAYGLEVSAVVAKTASGALEWVPWCRVNNLSGVLDMLRSNDVVCVGLDERENTTLSEALKLHVECESKPIALVLGSEGSGLREGTAERVHFSARLDLPGDHRILNVANAATSALQTLTHTRREHGGAGLQSGSPDER